MPTKDTTHLRLRVEERLLERLEKAAEKSRRTLTGEIVHRLEQSFRKENESATIQAAAATIQAAAIATATATAATVLDQVFSTPDYRTKIRNLLEEGDKS
jgi:hypothetical protein